MFMAINNGMHLSENNTSVITPRSSHKRLDISESALPLWHTDLQAHVEMELRWLEKTGTSLSSWQVQTFGLASPITASAKKNQGKHFQVDYQQNQKQYSAMHFKSKPYVWNNKKSSALFLWVSLKTEQSRGITVIHVQ